MLETQCFIPGLGRSPGEVNDNPLQCPCLENSMYRETRQCIVHRLTKSQAWLTDTQKTYHVTNWNQNRVIVGMKKGKYSKIMVTFLPPHSLLSTLPLLSHPFNSWIFSPKTSRWDPQWQSSKSDWNIRDIHIRNGERVQYNLLEPVWCEGSIQTEIWKHRREFIK